MPSRLVRLLLPLRCRGHGSDQGSGQRMDMLSGIRVAMLLLTMATMVFVLTHILLYSDSLSPVAVERGGGGEADYGFVDRKQHTGSTVRLFQRVCRADRRSLVRLIRVDTNESPSISSIIRDNPHLQPGGKYVPTGCRSQQKVAIIIPYRDRWQHLRLLLKHLHPMLQHQMVDYRIFVVEQAGQNIFNKGLIMNIAFDVATKLEDFDCFVYHDVDLIPESELNLYMCNSQARHLSPGVDQMRYVLMYNRLAGGVLALRRSQNIQVNGFSNIYWGWGAEDDDMSRRIWIRAVDNETAQSHRTLQNDQSSEKRGGDKQDGSAE
ncbi:PREDICTED: beta-1,4-N-acetylgalactosaminyltransferase bre-4-like isoform X2 [Priapulus caudatus]|nr:PREDICTED: beta-1,4-N-acetylgalactosaminyltransferase bre-4-like isoform X2 [Priapulus caudatus]XP_014665023.1 PREDICTED: beta-1,4-N-acetylgalactosaminyltransferase bre-4-like isoform X2 [Priapulus caudatus]